MKIPYNGIWNSIELRTISNIVVIHCYIKYFSEISLHKIRLSEAVSDVSVKQIFFNFRLFMEQIFIS